MSRYEKNNNNDDDNDIIIINNNNTNNDIVNHLKDDKRFRRQRLKFQTKSSGLRLTCFLGGGDI